MSQIQKVIHQIEVGGGLRIMKYVLPFMALLVLLLSYNMRGFKNMNNPEAMDSAQLARNIAEGKGYKTLCIRPFSVYLLESAYASRFGPAPIGDRTDRGQIRDLHPDISNPPAYPVLLAGMMKLSSACRYQTAGASKLDIGSRHLNPWNNAGAFWIYPPDFWISLLDQFIFLGTALLLFYLAQSLFDPRVAWTATALFLGTDLFWRFSISGLSTMMVMFEFLLLAVCLARLEKRTREHELSASRQFALAAAIGAITAVGCLTRYSFGWLIVPVVVFIGLFLGRQRILLCLVVLGVFVVVISPWLARNYHLSRTLFGTTSYSVYEKTPYFPEYRLMRSLSPDLTRIRSSQLWTKFVVNTQIIIQEDLPKLGGNWLSAFFLVGLLIKFNNATLSRLRYFALMCLPVLIAAQALGRTQLTDDSPVINSENLIILLAPLITMFGVSLFYVLLDQLHFPVPQLRYVLIGAFSLLICFPAVLNFLLARTPALAYPPYYPPMIQKVSTWMKPKELMMSDVPWAVAWYGERRCMWITLNAQDDFYSVYDKVPIQALYLTPITMDGRYLSQWMRGGERSWGSFVLDLALKKVVPPDFPLKRAPIGFLPEQLVLTDIDRWGTPTAP